MVIFLNDVQVHDLLVQSLDIKAIGSTALPKVLDEWRGPKHEEFQPRTAWSLWNAYTEVYKEYEQTRLPRRTIALQGLMDAYTRFVPKSDEEIGEEVLATAV